MNGRGVVLVSVLWLLVLMGLLAAEATRAVITEQRLVGNLVAAAQGRAAAEGGVYLGVLALLERGGDEWPVDGTPREFRVGDSLVRVRRYDESGRIDLNTASPELLQGLFDAAEVPQETGAALVDAILDWRDADHLHRLHGAEDADYRTLGRDYGARDDAFTRVDELRLVAGMEPALFARVRPALTVYARHSGINPRVAPRAALLAVPGVAPEAVERYLRQRELPAANGVALAAPEGMARRFLSAARGQDFTISAEATRPETSARLAVTLTLRRSAARPFTVLDWREGAEE